MIAATTLEKLERAPSIEHLEAQLATARGHKKRAEIADQLVPLLVRRSDAIESRRILDSIDILECDPDLRARILSLHAIVSAMEKWVPAADVERAAALAPVSEETHAIVLYRAALTYTIANDVVEAERYGIEALQYAQLTRQPRYVSRAASVLYGLQYHVKNDLKAARRYAELALEHTEGLDLAEQRFWIGAQYDLATAFGDWLTAARLRDMLLLVGREEGALAVTSHVSDALLLGAGGDFAAMQQIVEDYRPLLAITADHAMSHALLAIAFLGNGADAEARQSARRALGLSRANAFNDQAHLLTRRRIASVLGAYVLVSLGDVQYGTRCLDVRVKWAGPSGAMARSLLAATSGTHIDLEDPSLVVVRGYLEAILAAQTARRVRLEKTPELLRSLTTLEMSLVLAAADGLSNGDIARRRHVSRNAVERGLIRAYRKLGVHTRSAAIALLLKANPDAASEHGVRVS